MTSGLRTALWISVPLNALGVIVFGSAALGRPVMDLPLPIAPFYAAPDLARATPVAAGRTLDAPYPL